MERSTRWLQLRQSVEACPRDAPEAPSTANDRQQQHLANPNVDADLQPASNARDRLVMRKSLGGDDDQGAEAPAVLRDRRRRARCVPDRPVSVGNLRSFPDSPIHRFTCIQAGRPPARNELLSSGSHGAEPTRCAQDRRAISGPLATVTRGQSRPLRRIGVASSAGLTAVRHTPSKLVMRVRFPSPAPRNIHFNKYIRFTVQLIAARYRPSARMTFTRTFILFKIHFRTYLD
jgi:hypothetical protein